MATRELQTHREPVFCAVCHRSLLQGEHAVVFSDGHALHQVCELCTARAHRQGWVREGASVAPSSPAAHAARARSLVGRLRPRRDGATDAQEDDLEPLVPAAEGSARAQRQSEPRAAAGHEELLHAVRLFNASEHARTVSGVIRSLGSPYVHAELRASAATVELIVVWELCWYRYDIDLNGASVRLAGQGYEPAELGAELPAANAIADERGKLTIAPP